MHIIILYTGARIDCATWSIGQGIMNVGEEEEEEGVSLPIVRNGSPLPIYVYKYKIYNTHIINTRIIWVLLGRYI